MTTKDKTETLFDAKRMTEALTRWVEADAAVKRFSASNADGNELEVLLLARNTARAEFETLRDTFNQSADVVLSENTI